MTPSNKQKPSWTLVFVVLFLLSLDYWRWIEPIELGWLNFPTWLYYFIALQIALIICLYIFTRFYWGK